MALDICPAAAGRARRCSAWPSSAPLAWAARARRAHRREDQAIFGIVQGGHRRRPAGRERGRGRPRSDFDGYGIGGLSVGEPRDEMLPALAAALAELPADRPRYLMGVGDPVSIVEAVALGVDMFDCVLPTRLGRHGTALTGAGRLQLRSAAAGRATTGRSTRPAPARCARRFSRAYLRHLFIGRRADCAGRLLTLHNLAWTLDLMAAHPGRRSRPARLDALRRRAWPRCGRDAAGPRRRSAEAAR